MENQPEYHRVFIKEVRKTYDFSLEQDFKLDLYNKRSISTLSAPFRSQSKPLSHHLPADHTNYPITPAKYPEENIQHLQNPNCSFSNNPLTRSPENVYCQHCKTHITTQVIKTRGITAWVLCTILCLFCFPFCIYPLICDICLDTTHICPNCKAKIASIPIA